MHQHSLLLFWPMTVSPPMVYSLSILERLSKGRVLAQTSARKRRTCCKAQEIYFSNLKSSSCKTLVGVPRVSDTVHPLLTLLTANSRGVGKRNKKTSILQKHVPVILMRSKITACHKARHFTRTATARTDNVPCLKVGTSARCKGFSSGRHLVCVLHHHVLAALTEQLRHIH